MSYRFFVNILPTEKNQSVGASYAARFMRLVVETNRDEMRRARERGNPLPPLFNSGVRYDRKQGAIEEYTDCLTVKERGWGHCVDLTCWYIAETQDNGGSADIHCYWRDVKPNPGGKPMLEVHVMARKFFPNLSDPRYARLALMRKQVRELEATLRAECLPASELVDVSRLLGM